MRFLVSVSALALICALADDVWAQGRGGGCNRASGNTGGTTAVAGGSMITDPTLLTGSSSPSPTAILLAQMRLAYQMQRQQAYLAQVEAYAQRQQAAAAKKAEKKERQIASRKARREAELARRSGSASRSSLTSRDAQFAALAR